MFRHHHSSLVSATAPVVVSISNHLFTSEWISEPTLGRVNTSTSTPEEAATWIVMELHTSLKTKLMSGQNPREVILNLCSCLETQSNFKPIVQNIKGKSVHITPSIIASAVYRTQ